MTGGRYRPDGPEVYTAVTLDHVGRRYGLLPSEVMLRATTFDLQVLDLALSYEQYKSNKTEGQQPQLSQQDMMAALKSVQGSKQ